MYANPLKDKYIVGAIIALVIVALIQQLKKSSNNANSSSSMQPHETPNAGGHYNESQTNEVLNFFAKNELRLTEFSNKYNLKIRKYYHSGPDWSFDFRNNDSDYCSVAIGYIPTTSKLSITNSCYYDDYDHFTRFIKWGKGEYVEITANYDSLLELRICESMTWKKEHMKAYPDYEKTWGKFSKREFEKMSDTGSKFLTQYPNVCK